MMRAKMQVSMVQEHMSYDKTEKSMETLTMHAVCSNKYDETGLDEDNTYAKFTPGASLVINITNHELFDKFKVGDKYYIDFTFAEK